MENGNSGCFGLLIAVPIIVLFIWALIHFYDPIQPYPTSPPRVTPTTTVHVPHHHRE